MATKKRSPFSLGGATPALSTKWLLVTAALCLILQGREGDAQSLFPRAEILGGRGISDGSTFYVVLGNTIKFYCYCSGYESVEILHNGELVKSSNSSTCGALLYTVNASRADEGSYICRGLNGNAVAVTVPIGNMSVLDDDVVVAEPMQYGLIGRSTALNCTTTLNEREFVITTDWYSGSGISGTQLPRRPHFNRTSISDEGTFTCSIFIAQMNIRINKIITFSVVVPPRIFLEHEQLDFHGNERQVINVRFQSRFISDTRVTWWKNGVPLLPGSFADNIEVQNIIEETSPNATTTLTFNPTRRNDSGEYRVSVENNFEVIPRQQQYAEDSLTVKVSVLPAKPVLNDVVLPFDTVSWLFTERSEDERADNFTVLLKFTQNETIAQQLTVAGHVRQTQLSIVPGMNYTVSIIARNQDGQTVSESRQFGTPPGAPSIPFLQVRRVSNFSIELTVSLAYTGGGDITNLDVSFRKIGTKEWILIGAHDAQSMPDSEMTWKALVRDQRFAGIGVEFQVVVINTHQHRSEPVILLEPLELPTAPSLSSITTSTNSLMLQVTISSEGTPPILSLVVEFVAPEPFMKNFTGPFIQGETYSIEVTGLRDNTQYSFTLSTVNYQGRGTATHQYNSTTAKLPPIPSYAIILIAIAAAVLIILVILLLAIVSVLKHRRHRQKKTYSFNHATTMTAEDKELEATHEMVRRGSNSYTQHNPSLPSSRSILSNSTANSSSYIPTCMSPPFSPGSGSGSGTNTTTPGPTSILRISDPSAIDRYRYETCSSTTSNSVQSEESDAGIRYTYNISPSPPVEIDTPDLRAHSSYSVMTSTTRMTSSSNSTRESLAYHHESNATVV